MLHLEKGFGKLLMVTTRFHDNGNRGCDNGSVKNWVWEKKTASAKQRISHQRRIWSCNAYTVAYKGFHPEMGQQMQNNPIYIVSFTIYFTNKSSVNLTHEQMSIII